MQKGAVLLLLLLGAVIVGGLVGALVYFNQAQGGVVKQPPILPQKRDNLKTYTNNKLNFQLQYSKDLQVQVDSEEEFNKRGGGDFRKNFKGYIQYEPGKVLGTVVVLDSDNSYETNPFTVWVFNNTDDLSIDEWYKNYWYYPFVWGDFTYTGKTTLAPKNEATISGQMAKFGVIDYQPGKPKFVYLANNKKMYLFRIIGAEGDKILSSLVLY